MSLKCLKELLKYFFLCLFASTHVRVLLSIVALSNIFDIDVAIFIEVELLEDSLDQIFPEWAHITLNSLKKLIERDTIVTVDIKK